MSAQRFWLGHLHCHARLQIRRSPDFGLDFRIPDVQGLAAFTALQRRGIPSEFLNFPDENHWVVKPANSILWHDTVLNWMKRWTAEE